MALRYDGIGNRSDGNGRGVQAEILLHPHLQPEPKQQIVVPA